MAPAPQVSDRPTLLLLPGNMCDERMWSGLLPWLGERAVAAPVPTEATIEAMAATCLERHPGRLMPVGFSMGGIVALAIARAAPDRVAALALLDTNAGADAPREERAPPPPAERGARGRTWSGWSPRS